MKVRGLSLLKTNCQNQTLTIVFLKVMTCLSELNDPYFGKIKWIWFARVPFLISLLTYAVLLWGGDKNPAAASPWLAFFFAFASKFTIMRDSLNDSHGRSTLLVSSNFTFRQTKKTSRTFQLS